MLDQSLVDMSVLSAGIDLMFAREGPPYMAVSFCVGISLLLPAPKGGRVQLMIHIYIFNIRLYDFHSLHGGD